MNLLPSSLRVRERRGADGGTCTALLGDVVPQPFAPSGDPLQFKLQLVCHLE